MPLRLRPIAAVAVRSRNLRLLADGGSLTEIAEAIGVSHTVSANHCRQLRAKLATLRTADPIRVAIPLGLGPWRIPLAAPPRRRQGADAARLA